MSELIQFSDIFITTKRCSSVFPSGVVSLIWEMQDKSKSYLQQQQIAPVCKHFWLNTETVEFTKVNSQLALFYSILSEL